MPHSITRSISKQGTTLHHPYMKPPQSLRSTPARLLTSAAGYSFSRPKTSSVAPVGVKSTLHVKATRPQEFAPL